MPPPEKDWAPRWQRRAPKPQQPRSSQPHESSAAFPALQAQTALPAVAEAPSIIPSQRPLSQAARDRLFGPVAFESGLPDAFLGRRR
jgi:hypothetical protein